MFETCNSDCHSLLLNSQHVNYRRTVGVQSEVLKKNVMGERHQSESYLFLLLKQNCVAGEAAPHQN